MDNLLNDVTQRMEKSLSALRSSFNKIRTGRANPSILDDVHVDYYGNQTPLNQTSNISIEEGRSLVISPWDKNLIPEIEKAILSSDLGLIRLGQEGQIHQYLMMFMWITMAIKHH